MTNINDLERTVVDLLIDGNTRPLSILRAQFRAAKVSSRRVTGAGFFTEFVIPDHIPSLPDNVSAKIGDLNGSGSNIKNGVGFLLYIDHGRISALEGYSYDEPFPDQIENLVLVYTDENKRDIPKVLQL